MSEETTTTVDWSLSTEYKKGSYSSTREVYVVRTLEGEKPKRFGPFDEDAKAQWFRHFAAEQYEALIAWAENEEETDPPADDEELQFIAGLLNDNPIPGDYPWHYQADFSGACGWGQGSSNWFGYGDYWHGLLNESNCHRVHDDLAKTWPDDVHIQYGGFSSANLLVNCANVPLIREFKEICENLEDYPAYDDEDYSERENETLYKYFDEDVFRYDIRKWAEENAIPELTQLDADGEPEFIDWKRFKHALEYRMYDFMHLDNDDRTPYFDEGEFSRLWDSERKYDDPLRNDILPLRRKLDHYRLMLAGWGQQYQEMLPGICPCDGNAETGPTFFSPARHRVLKVICPMHQKKLYLIEEREQEVEDEEVA